MDVCRPITGLRLGYRLVVLFFKVLQGRVISLSVRCGLMSWARMKAPSGKSVADVNQFEETLKDLAGGDGP